MNSCMYCGALAFYRDRESGAYLCPLHARLEVAGPRGEAPYPPLTIRPAVVADRLRIAELIEVFLGRVEMACFSRRYRVDTLPAYVACDADEIVGIASYAWEEDVVNLVTLKVAPRWQGRGVAHWLIAMLIDIVRTEGARRLIVATTNDNLPALAFYQRLGFVITSLVVGGALERCGEVGLGFASIPVRDEIQMELHL